MLSVGVSDMAASVLNLEIKTVLANLRTSETVVIADRGFPFWPGLHTIDLSLIDDIPRVAEVLSVLRSEIGFRRAWMAKEFLPANTPSERVPLEGVLAGVELIFEPHIQLKRRVPDAVCLIRTADRLQYSNLVLEVG
jgi:D-ribose pyranase